MGKWLIIGAVAVVVIVAAVIVLTGRDLTEQELYAEAQAHWNQGEFAEAADYYEELIERFPGSAHRPVALFTVGYTNANALSDLDKAREYYTTFLNEYPDHELAAGAKFELEHLGKSPEQLNEILQGMLDTTETVKR